MTDSMIDKANQEFDEVRQDVPALEAIRPDFQKAFDKFADENHVLLSLEINSPDIYGWVKRTAEVFYFMGRGEQ